MKIVRGMLGMGLTFSLGIGAIATAVAGLGWLIPGIGSGPETFRLAAASAIWAFPIGVAFSGAMALTAGGRRFADLSVPRFAALGAGAGLLLYGLLAVNAWDAWSVQNAIGNAVIFIGLGSGSATATLLIARRAQPSLGSGDDLRLDDGDDGPRPTDDLPLDRGDDVGR
jgi:hypothetical protein